MPKFKVNFRTVANATVTVEADDEESALDAAYEDLPPDLCHQCAGWRQRYSVEIGEWEPTDQKWPVMEPYQAVEKVEG